MIYLSILIYFSYIIYVYIKYRPDCISQTYYLLKNKDIFTWWIILVAFSLFPSWVEISPENYQFLPFLSVCSLIIVGICPKYLDSDRIAHLTAASITFILSIIWSIIVGMYIIPIIFVVIILFLYNHKNLLFWAENSAFLNIYLSILLS